MKEPNAENINKSVAIDVLYSMSHRDLCAKVVELTAEKHRLELALDKATDAVTGLRQEIQAAALVLGVAVGINGDLIDRCNKARNKLAESEMPF